MFQKLRENVSSRGCETKHIYINVYIKTRVTVLVLVLMCTRLFFLPNTINFSRARIVWTFFTRIPRSCHPNMIRVTLIFIMADE